LSLTNDTVYTGQIVSAKLRMAYKSGGDLDAVFDVNISHEDGTVDKIRCKHPCYGEKLDRTKEVLDLLNVDYPDELEGIHMTEGEEVQVWIGEYSGHQYGKINVGGDRVSPDDPEAIAAALKKLKGDTDGSQF